MAGIIVALLISLISYVLLQSVSIMKPRLPLLMLAAMLLTPVSGIADALTIQLGRNDEIPVERHRADGNTLILWTPSSFGMQPQANALAQELAFENLEVWLADLHTGFFVPRGRNSVDQFNPALVADLIDKALARSGKKRVLLLTTGSGAQPLLQAARIWQRRHPGDGSLAGMLLFHPSLYAGRPALGQVAEYLPVARETNLPVFIVQPTLSTTYHRVPELQNVLRSGGSMVYLQILEGVRDGFHVRPDDQLDDRDRQAKSGLSTLIRQASQLLLQAATPPRPAPAMASTGPAGDSAPGLRKYRIQPRPPLALRDLSGKLHRLEDYRDKVVLVSFWASWCPPCIEELPSMNRLHAALGERRFEIIGVNIGERKNDVQEFLKRHPIDFTILMDPDSTAYGAWNIYVVPSNFVIDGKGEVRMGSVGAIEWDSPEVIAELKSLIRQTTN